MNNGGENIRERAYKFSLEVVRLTRKFPKNSEGFAISSQLVRSGTSISANLFEGSAGVSKKEFTQFLSISKKSAVETGFWLRLSHDLDFISDDEYQDKFRECDEITRIISKIILNSKQ